MENSYANFTHNFNSGLLLGTVGFRRRCHGQAIYNKSCKTCHGADGTANPAIAKMMNVEIKDLKSPEVQSMSNDDLKKVITAGKGKMKSVSAVSGGAVDDVVAYVHALKN